MSNEKSSPHRIPRYCVSWDIHDNDRQETLTHDGYNTDSLRHVAADFRRIAGQVEDLLREDLSR